MRSPISRSAVDSGPRRRYGSTLGRRAPPRVWYGRGHDGIPGRISLQGVWLLERQARRGVGEGRPGELLGRAGSLRRLQGAERRGPGGSAAGAARASLRPVQRAPRAARRDRRGRAVSGLRRHAGLRVARKLGLTLRVSWVRFVTLLPLAAAPRAPRRGWPGRARAGGEPWPRVEDRAHLPRRLPRSARCRVVVDRAAWPAMVPRYVRKASRAWRLVRPWNAAAVVSGAQWRRREGVEPSVPREEGQRGS